MSTCRNTIQFWSISLLNFVEKCNSAKISKLFFGKSSNILNEYVARKKIEKKFSTKTLILQIKTSGSKIHTINIAVNTTSTGYVHFCHEIFCLCVHLIELNWYQIAISH